MVRCYFECVDLNVIIAHIQGRRVNILNLPPPLGWRLMYESFFSYFGLCLKQFLQILIQIYSNEFLLD